MLDDQFGEDEEQPSSGEESDDEDNEDFDGDGGRIQVTNVSTHPDVGRTFAEGLKHQDAGWTKIAARNLVPRAYSLLMNNGWYLAYAKPPAIMDS